MKLIIVRHGQSEADLLKVIEGRADFPLTELGREQVAMLSEWLVEHEKIDVILASSLKRAAETADTIARAMELKVEYTDDLMEWDNGLLAGLSFEEADMRFPLPEGGRKPHHTMAETESLIQFRARAEHFLSWLRETYDEDQCICLVSHGGMINMLFRSLVELPMTSGHILKSGDTAVHKFELMKDHCRLCYTNRDEHLRR